MNKAAIRVMKRECKKFIKDNGLTWGNMQKNSIKEAPLFFPVGWGVLYRIVMKNSDRVHPNRIKDILDHFNVPCEQKYGIITLTEETEDNEE